jgi:cysteinyl-tRNA synthetase
VRELLRRFDADSIRVTLLRHHYREPWEYTEEQLVDAAGWIGRLRDQAAHVPIGAGDGGAAIRAAFQRDHVALEHLRQPASALKGSAHPAFNQLISNDEATLVELEKTALASNSGSAASSIAAMDQLVASAQAELNRQLATAGATKTTGNGHLKKN